MKKILIVLCVIWISFIFYNSSNSGKTSQQRSGEIVNIIQKVGAKTETVFKNNNIKQINIKRSKLNYMVRKNAHFFQYFILASLICAAFFAFNHKGKDILVYILFILLICSVTDEFFQRFVPNRTSNVLDIVIDFCGGLCGTGVFYILYYRVYEKNIIQFSQYQNTRKRR